MRHRNPYKKADRETRVRRLRIVILVIAAALALFVGVRISRKMRSGESIVPGVAYANTIKHDEAFWSGSPDITAEMLDPNPYSRPQKVLTKIDGIVIHYTADPGASAQNVRDYFNNLATTHTTYASSHFIVGLNGEIIQCIPCSEWAYCSNSRNKDTLSIKVSPDNVIRHYDVTGKLCPKWFVEDPSAWETFKSDVKTQYEKIS